VLLVEDNPDDVELIRILSTEMTAGSLEITATGCLSAGTKLLSEKEFDIVLLDLFLPDSAGIGTLAGLHAIIAELPIIVMTGHNGEELAGRAVQQGAQDYLIKAYIEDGRIMLLELMGYIVTFYRNY
jgi:DNA-binding NtrC family response regulator